MKIPCGVDLDNRFNIMATILHTHFKYQEGPHTRLFELVIYNDWITVGQSDNGGEYSEHVVPLAFLVKMSKHIFFYHGATIEDLAKLLRRYLKVVKVTEAEARYMNEGLRLKIAMPRGWDGEDEFARLRSAGIKWRPIVPSECRR